MVQLRESRDTQGRRCWASWLALKMKLSSLWLHFVLFFVWFPSSPLLFKQTNKKNLFGDNLSVRMAVRPSVWYCTSVSFSGSSWFLCSLPPVCLIQTLTLFILESYNWICFINPSLALQYVLYNLYYALLFLFCIHPLTWVQRGWGSIWNFHLFIILQMIYWIFIFGWLLI